jgi:sulfur carrier protein
VVSKGEGNAVGLSVKVNGEWRDIPDVTTVAALLAHFRISPEACGVLRNGQVVAREAFATEPVAAGDILEIVRFVGGG